MPWGSKFRVESQEQKLVTEEMSSDNVSLGWIKGFAGSGKTLILKDILKRHKIDYPSDDVCFITYTHALGDMVKGEGDIENCHVCTHTQFLSDRRSYDLVCLDEVQDIKLSDLIKIKSYARKLIVCGDNTQQIYPSSASEGEIESVLKYCTERSLHKVYRTTKKILEIADCIYPDANLFAAIPDGQALKRGVDANYAQFNSLEEEVKFIWERARDECAAHESVGILFPKHKDVATFGKVLASILGLPTPPKRGYKYKSGDYEDFNDFWESNDIPLQYVGGGNGSFERGNSEPMVYLLTYHSSKGLDFYSVYLPFLDEDKDIAWDSIRNSIPDIERKLFFVASTRSRGDLTYTFTGNAPHPFLQEIIDEGFLNQIEDFSTGDELADNDDDEDDDFF